MKKSYLAVLLGVSIGVVGTLGGQWIAENAANLIPAPQPNFDFSGFEDEYTFEATDYDELRSRYYPDASGSDPLEFEALNIDEDIRLGEDGYFVIHDEELEWSGATVNYTVFTHFNENLNTLWQYEFIPSADYMSTMISVGEYYFDFFIEDLEQIGNHILVTGSFENYTTYFNQDSQAEQKMYIGENFEPIGANEDLDIDEFNFALSINLDTYRFELVELLPITEDYSVEWHDTVDLGDDVLVHILLENKNPFENFTLYETDINANYANYNFFTRLTPANNDIGFTITKLGYIFTNLDVDLDWYDLRDFNGRYFDFIDAKFHFNIEFNYGHWYEPYGNADPLHVDFSDGFELINPENRSAIEAYFGEYELQNNTEEVRLEYHAITETETLESFHVTLLETSFESTQNSTWKDVSYSYASENDYAVITSQEVYNYDGEGVWNLQVIESESTIEEYRNGRLVATTVFDGDDGLVINTLVRTTNHFIVGGTTSFYVPMLIDNNLIPTGLVALMDRDFNFIDGVNFNTNASTFIEGILLVDNTLEVALWTASVNEEYFEILQVSNIISTTLTLTLD